MDGPVPRGAHRGPPVGAHPAVGPSRRRRGRAPPVEHSRQRLRLRHRRLHRRHPGGARPRRAQPGRLHLPVHRDRRRAVEAGAAGAGRHRPLPAHRPRRRGRGASAPGAHRRPPTRALPPPGPQGGTAERRRRPGHDRGRAPPRRGLPAGRRRVPAGRAGRHDARSATSGRRPAPRTGGGRPIPRRHRRCHGRDPLAADPRRPGSASRARPGGRGDRGCHRPPRPGDDGDSEP